MAWWLKQNVDAEFVYCFANTGQEHEKTLEFVDRCDKEWDLGVVWLEAVVHHGERKGSTHKIVNYETASRNGEPFEEVIRKYGIPNMTFQPCTRELKTNPMRSFRKEYWGGRPYETAIGIRVDEIDRMQPDANEKGLIYPLVSMNPADKAAVNRFWESQPFTLELEPLLGNCVWCWKKTLRKHLTIIESHPEFYDFPERMEKQYANAGAGDGPRVFFRQHRSTRDLRAMASQPFKRWIEEYNYDLFSEMDMPSGCTESCEVEF